MNETRESKIVFKDGERVRVIRGEISAEDDFFLTVQRRDGTLRIAKGCIEKIEEWKSGELDERRK